MAHPLNGANIKTLTQIVGRSGLPQNPLQGAMIGASAIARWPFSQIERLWLQGKLPAIDDMPPPVFILGHWRSGTTHLYNIMTKSGAWGYVPPVATGLPWDLFGIARVFNPLLEKALPKHRYIDKIPVTPDSPQEDEIALANMSPLSFYHGIYFPKEFSDYLGRGLFFDGCTQKEVEAWEEQFVYLMRKLYVHQDKKQLLIKNPVYTGRLATLKRLFPKAKFVHIHRNPYDVFRSMQNFYKKLFKQLALQGYDHVDIDEVILTVYPRMMRQLEEDAKLVDPDHYFEIGYDALDSRPIETLETIYSKLSLSGFDEAKPHFENYLSSVESFEKNKFKYSAVSARKVETRWDYFLKKWDYQKPQ